LVGSSSTPIVTPPNLHFISSNQGFTERMTGATFGADSHRVLRRALSGE
jgi:hypothetical protein